ncbi:MAG: XdhC/CoxI family protein [Actinobacteria bacterium]|nr:XdhC/CoxI family protein [Actinomycetota bacterium]
MSVQGAFAAIAREDGRAALVTAVRGPHAGARMLVRADGDAEGTLGDPALDAEALARAEELMWAERSEVEVVVGWPEKALAQLGGIDRATYIAVLTHDPKLDDAALLLSLRSDAAYIGAMGSKRAQAERRERLLAAGVTELELARISAPIGLDLGALSSQETALSIMAELIAVRYGREGGRLAHRGGRRIHDVPDSGQDAATPAA